MVTRQATQGDALGLRHLKVERWQRLMTYGSNSPVSKDAQQRRLVLATVLLCIQNKIYNKTGSYLVFFFVILIKT